MKKFKFIFLLVFAMFIMLPFKVFAESPECDSVRIELQDIKLGDKGQETTYAIGGIHFVTPTIYITWYESSNGSDYTLMDENSTFDYNIYYKAVLDTSYDELNDGFDEGWELCGLSLDIIDEDNTVIDSKSYNSNSNLEYVFEPFWKYDVVLEYLENMEYIGPKQIVEGEKFVGQLVPKKNYRLPNEYEINYMRYIDISVDFVNNQTGAFDEASGYIEIDPWHITGDIYIKAIAVEKDKIEFENNKYSYVKNNIMNGLEFTVPFQEDIDSIMIGEKVISNNDYFYDKTNDRLKIEDTFLDTLEVGTYKLRIENNNRYAETTISVQELEVVDKITIDFREISNEDLFTEDKLSAFQFLGIDKGFLALNEDLGAICDKNQKILLYIDDDGNITLAENLSYNDNIIYTLSAEDLENYRNNYAYLKIPKTIEIIFAEDLVETYKIIFDANGGAFKNDVKTIDIEDIINFDYEAFEKPTREGYKFIGFYTVDGESYYDIMNSEAGIEEDTTFYAKWEENSTTTPSIPEEENPKTFDGIGSSIIMGTISLIGLVGTTIYLKKKNKVNI